jgi:large repetitive protein
VRPRTARRARKIGVLLGVLMAAGIVFAAMAVAAAAPAAPTLTSTPPNPNASTSASFVFTGESGSTFECRRDSEASFTACSTPKSYTALALGSHTFRVRAIKGGKTSSETTYTWSIAAPAAPTIGTKPPNPTNLQTASFSFTANTANAVFECRLDAAAYASCTSPRNYSGLALGSHTFRVRALGPSGSSAGTGPETAYTWTIEQTPPAVSSINRSGASPTTASSVQWQVIFSEAVTGVDAADLALVRAGLGGSSSVTSVSGSGTAYAVTASTGSGTGTIRLDLVDNDSIQDLAGNKLGGTGAGNGNFAGQVYAIDRTEPATPVFTLTPPDPSGTATSTFAWTDATPADVDHYECSKENGAFVVCTTPHTYAVATTNSGTHQFGVRAVDAAGNVSGVASYSWKVDKDARQDFTITGDLGPALLLYPGGATRTIPVALHNPNGVPIQVTALTVGINASSLPPGCQASWFQITQSDVSSANAVAVAANSTVTLPSGSVSAPTIRMLDSGNQDVCQGATFQLTYSGSAQS